jgi:hypothetical protein
MAAHTDLPEQMSDTFHYKHQTVRSAKPNMLILASGVG